MVKELNEANPKTGVITIVDMPKRSKLKLAPLKLATEETFGQRLARIRKERGYTQVELASKMGLTQALVTDYERGKLRMHAEMVVRFSQSLDVSTDELLGVTRAAMAAKRKGQALSLKIVRRLQRIEKLPDPQQKTLLKSIDLLLGGAGSLTA